MNTKEKLEKNKVLMLVLIFLAKSHNIWIKELADGYSNN